MNRPITFRTQAVAIESLPRLRKGLLMDPHYQRQGDVWSRPRRRLFVDSLLNGFIVPAMYWHSLESNSEYFDGQSRYAVVDGRQRLEAIFSFLDDDLSLTNENVLLADPTIELAGLNASGLRTEHPWLFAALMRTPIEVIFIDTADTELIEELFSRLNEGVPLSAAERRNRGSILAPEVRGFTADHPFFADKLPFANTRYRHYDLLAKFMRIEDRGLNDGRVPDLRKADLDRLFERLRKGEDTDPDATRLEIEQLLAQVREILDKLTPLFESPDKRLSSVGMITLYYAISHWLWAEGREPLSGDEIDHFEDLRSGVKGKDEDELTPDESLAVEFARFSQGTTSGAYLTSRLEIFLKVERGLIIDPPSHYSDTAP